MERDWQTTQPPNEVTVEVEDGDRIIQVQAYYGRDGMRPHWRTPDGNTCWSVDAFRRWRLLNGT